MFAYISVYFINILSSFFLFKEWGKAVLFFFVCYLVALLGFRGVGVGVDTANYYYSYLMIGAGGGEVKDPLYYFSVKAVSMLGFGPEAIIFLFSILTIVPLSLLMYKRSPYPVLSFAVLFAFGFYAFYFNGMRQGASMTFGVLFVHYLLKSEGLKASAALLVSIMMHFSAVVLAPIYILYKLPVKYRLFIVVALWPVSLLAAYEGYVFYSILRSVEFIIPARFLNYIQLGDVSDKGLSFVFDQAVFLFLLFLCFRIKEMRRDLYVFLGMMGIVFLYLFSGVKYVDRLALYYYIFCVMALPIAMASIKGPWVRFWVIVIFVVLLGIQFLYRANVDPHHIFPYYTIFNENGGDN